VGAAAGESFEDLGEQRGRDAGVDDLDGGGLIFAAEGDDDVGAGWGVGAGVAEAPWASPTASTSRADRSTGVSLCIGHESPVDRGDTGQLLSEHRNVASSRTASPSFGASGTVTAVPVKTVKAGQMLATIDDDTAQRTLNSAGAELKSARASYDELAEGRPTRRRRRTSCRSSRPS
jgi:multidrug efflux pump subunit AcrA (membrane-fusion protein)